MHEMLKTSFWENKENISEDYLLKFLPSMLSITQRCTTRKSIKIVAVIQSLDNRGIRKKIFSTIMHVVGTLKKQLCVILLKRNLTGVLIKNLKKKKHINTYFVDKKSALSRAVVMSHYNYLGEV